jgi:glycosyltransferase involved in cell wall biosynthesis
VTLPAETTTPSLLDPLRRILVLVPHEPQLDPRIGWSIDVCRGLARTEVVAATWNTQRPLREYDGVVSIERVDSRIYAGESASRASALAQRLGSTRFARRFVENQGRRQGRGLRAALAYHVGAFCRLASAWAYYALIIAALRHRGRTLSVPPAVILCHDIYALLPGVGMKRRFGSRLVYDTHEYFPESDLLAPRWQRALTRAIERRFIRHADAVITVSPPLRDELAQCYGLPKVYSVPNAEPFVPGSPEPSPPPDAGRVRFLLQGQASPGRGIARLLELWAGLDDDRAELSLRIPDGDYPSQLRLRFEDLFSSGRVRWLTAVTESELVSAARSAHVGIIPYVGPSKNHLFASPNKLSQYMLAGLAILSTDLPYISSVLQEFRCGVTYDPADPASFQRAVRALVERPEELQEMRMNAFAAARDAFNWQTVGAEYRNVVEAQLRRA